MNYELIENNVGMVYSTITDGAFNDVNDDPSDVIEEFKFRYGNIANLAYDLEDRIEEIFDECVTKEDFIEALKQYFNW